MGMYLSGATQQGVMDMVGNVWEWCLNTYEHSELPESLRNDESNTSRVLRGGCWNDWSELLRVSNRSGFDADNRVNFIGFRLVQDIP